METIDLHLTGVDPHTVHVHVTVLPTEAIERLITLENMMTALSDAVDALQERINVDVTELLRQISELSGLLDTAMANDASDAAAIADLTAQRDDLLAQINETISRISTIDPVADFPNVEPAP
jgi:hypothetical protein